ncbi:MAG: hypothetical protein AAF696_05615, partial [Bacteroidota bacterium]
MISRITSTLLFVAIMIASQLAIAQSILPISSIPEKYREDADAVVQHSSLKVSVTAKDKSIREEVQIISILNKK